ncbi:agmatinase [Prochlorococcus sp. MIT 1307]|uniref:agmatinase n=1 Tax=Prochlorococcus sp. MIT 1307 TaxID=3096219 RepID=UPI002A7601CE|nr:agmatinase [Prochlorococcus sp. MIT 1307]
MTYQEVHCNASFNTEGAIFMGANRISKGCKVGIFGVPYDGTTSFRPGARFGPSSIREVSSSLETYCPQLDLDLESLAFADFGSLKIPYGAPEAVVNEVNKATQYLLALGIRPLILGGEHSISVGAVNATAQENPDLILLQLDAHADLRKEWLGSTHSHACSMRRCLEVLPSKQIFQLAIRSGTREEFQELKDQNQLIPHIHGQPATYLEKALMPHLGKAIYLTVDLDWFDPSIMPGTGTPEPGGFFWQDFAAIIDVLKKHNLVAADIVELSPQLDHSGISSILAAKATRSLVMLLSTCT